MLRRTPLPPGVLEAARDRKGRRVSLSEKAMRHIEEGHREMRGAELMILSAIEEAWIRTRAQKNREKFYARNLGPAAWLVVVVAFSGGEGRVITAYPDKRGPKKVDDRI
jgi:hypothetical protein